MTVGDLMTSDVQTLGRNDELSVADDLMAQRRIRHLPVLDEDGTLVGIVSQRDMFRGALARALGYGTSAQQRLLTLLAVKEIMTTDVITVRPDAPIVTAAALMLQHKVGCLPVIAAGRLVGIVTESDFVALVLAERAPEGGAVE
jgi:CBS domain-containing membrane protein